MDTKSKNYRSIAALLVVLIIILPSLAMMVIRPHYTKDVKTQERVFDPSYLSQMLVNSNYVLYAEEKAREAGSVLNPFDIFFPSALNSGSVEKEKAASESADNRYKNTFGNAENDGYSSDEAIQYSSSEVEDAYESWESDYTILSPYLQYQVLDGDKKVLASNTEEDIYKLLSKSSEDHLASAYGFGAVITYDDGGNVTQATYYSPDGNNGGQSLNTAARGNIFQYLKDNYSMDAPFQKPQGRTFVYLMTEQNLASLIENNMDMITYQPGYYTNNGVELLFAFAVMIGFVSLCALLLPFLKPLAMGKHKLLRAPLELVLLTGGITAYTSAVVTLDSQVFTGNTLKNFLSEIGMEADAISVLQYLWGFLGWALIFAICYWCVSCLRAIFTLGPARYIKERVILYQIWPLMKRIGRKIKRLVLGVYQSLLSVDFRDNTNKILIKIVLINFIILGFISLMWVWGIGALLLYSIALFFLLHKYCTDLQKQYSRLLSATNQLAEGNLNGTIPENLGVFEPFRDEISKIQGGFKKALEEEVKSQRMKSDLITNVSHDLKTPLTAIITYVDLLKKPDITEEERESYIQILDQKSTRLKLLIEDLFEVSKATSRNITLNIQDVDIVSLMQQAKLELQDKIDASSLLIRWRLPEEKVILPLDSQKTYRVFENLLLNITKYAMPHTRVYVDMENTPKQVRITMKNISATELSFNPSEITERFVRGDSSRNTEGSGLGLAIAKSFTDLQGGTLNIHVDADLFTAEIILPKKELNKKSAIVS